MNECRVRLHNWVDGVLKFTDHKFKTLDDAIEFASTAEDCCSIKVFDEDNRMVHHIQNITKESNNTDE